MQDCIVKLRLLGDARIDINGRSYGPEATHVFGALLVLALEPRHTLSRQRLARLLWPDAAAERRAARLRWLINKIRGLGAPVDATSADIGIPRSLVRSDHTDLLADLDAGTANESLRRVDEIDAVLRDYIPAFSTAFQRWVDDQRDRLTDELIGHLVPLLGGARRRGDWAATERVARAIRRLSSMHEEATLALAEALCANGDKAHGIRVIDDYLKEIEEDESPMRLPAELLRRRISTYAVAAESSQPRIPFVGRREQLRNFQSMLADAAAGRGSALLFAGPAGIGKSRLLEEAAGFAASVGRAAVVRAVCQAGDALRPLSGLTDVIPELLEMPGGAGCEPTTLRILAQLGQVEESGFVGTQTGESSLAGTQPSHVALCDAVVDLVCAVSDERPLVVQIDDFHWSDAASRTWLWETVLPRTRNQRVLWCFAARVEQPADAEALFSPRVRALVASDWLLGFDRNDANAFLDHHLERTRGAISSAWRESLLQRGGGIPLVLQELLRHWSEMGDPVSVPSSLGALMDARLARLSPSARRTLQVSALLGTFSTLERLEGVLELPRALFVDAVAELESAGILASDATGMTHGHVLWAEASLRHVEPSVLRVLHRHVAQQFDRELETAPSPACLWESARHWELCGQADRALAAIVRGAEHLARNGLYPEAAGAYQRAMDNSRDARQRREYVRRRIELFRLSGLWGELPAEIDCHEQLAREIDPLRDRHNDLEPIRRQALYQMFGTSAGLADEALACASDQIADTSHRIQAGYDCVRYGIEGGRYDVIGKGYHILASLTPVAPEDVRPHALGTIMFNLLLGDQHRALEEAARWAEYERRGGDPYSMSWSARMLAYSSTAVGDIEGAKRAYTEAIQVAREARLWMMLFAAHELLVALMIEYDEPAAARERIELAWAECEPFSGQVPNVAQAFSIHRAELALEEGNGADALRQLPTEPARAGARTARTIELAVRLGSDLLMNPMCRDGQAHALAEQLARSFERPAYGLGQAAGTYAQYLDMYHGAALTDDFMRRFTESIWRELLPTRRLAPFVARLGRPAPALKSPAARGSPFLT